MFSSSDVSGTSRALFGGFVDCADAVDQRVIGLNVICRFGRIPKFTLELPSSVFARTYTPSCLVLVCFAGHCWTLDTGFGSWRSPKSSALYYNSLVFLLILTVPWCFHSVPFARSAQSQRTTKHIASALNFEIADLPVGVKTQIGKTGQNLLPPRHCNML